MTRVALAVVLLVVLAGCAIRRVSSASADHTPSWGDDKATIELRRKPSREDFGLNTPDPTITGYHRRCGVSAIDTTVLLPTGTLRIPAYGIPVDCGPEPTTGPIPPKTVLVQRLFDNPDEVMPTLLREAPLLEVVTRRPRRDRPRHHSGRYPFTHQPRDPWLRQGLAVRLR